HPDVSQNVQFGVLDRDVLFNKEVLPAFSTFIIENVRVVEVTDQNLYGLVRINPSLFHVSAARCPLILLCLSVMWQRLPAAIWIGIC
ncbi:hypothetical protein NL445_27995, partial [Klebsiella pneumoniae]|nr:hypothetical protein [Klebsiella pneumoniae]